MRQPWIVAFRVIHTKGAYQIFNNGWCKKIQRERIKSSIMAGVKKSVSRPMWMLIFFKERFFDSSKRDDHGNQEQGCEQRIISLPTPKVSVKFEAM
jgi:hypothetical protein